MANVCSLAGWLAGRPAALSPGNECDYGYDDAAAAFSWELGRKY